MSKREQGEDLTFAQLRLTWTKELRGCSGWTSMVGSRQVCCLSGATLENCRGRHNQTGCILIHEGTLVTHTLSTPDPSSMVSWRQLRIWPKYMSWFCHLPAA